MVDIDDDSMQEENLITEEVKSLRKQEGMMRSRAQWEAGPASSRNTSSIVTGERRVYNAVDFLKGVRLRMKKCGMFEETMFGKSHIIWGDILLFCFVSFSKYK